MRREAMTQPLLTIAVPTFNRAAYLESLLAVLGPEAAAFADEVEIVVSDNCSEDRTPEVVASAEERFRERGVELRGVRHAMNIGADANFVSCFRGARGKFFWMCSDDDVIVPGALAELMPLLRETPELDMIYASSYGFHGAFRPERHPDPMGRTVHTYRNARTFAFVVNTMFSFVSGMIVNRERLAEVMLVAPEELIGTNLVQLGWSLPMLMQPRVSMALWTRPVAARLGNAHGYAVGTVFGENLAANVRRLLPGRAELQSAILNPALRRWFPSVLIDVRTSGNTTLAIDRAHEALARTFGSNPRYWVFTWPALTWPLPLAKMWTQGTAVVSKAIYVLRVPGFWRKRT